MSKASILIVDDDLSFRMYLSDFLRREGYAVDALADRDQLLARLDSGPIPSLILLDVMLQHSDGIEIIEKIKATGLNLPVIMISGVGLVKRIVEAMKLGASDFLMKPVDEDVLEQALDRALQNSVSPLSPPVPTSGMAKEHVNGFVSVNARVLRFAEIVRRVAPTEVPILILGESGVGKEVMARHAHAHSGRGNKPFVKVNCAALPHELLESELFGYDRGAFTGALTDKSGKFEQAHTGTLLLDEIGEMSPHLQSKLLHVLQDGEFTRLGGRKPVRVDARIIATTNIKIDQAIAAGTFREDLYFRLNVISLDLPPLRERKEDIPALCNYFIAKYHDQYNGMTWELPTELLNRFLDYDWPGNIRQLENYIKRFLVLPDHHSLFAEIGSSEGSPVQNTPPAADNGQSLSLLKVGAGAADRAERELVRRVMEETHGNRKQAAKRMNICYKALLNKMKRWAVTSQAA